MKMYCQGCGWSFSNDSVMAQPSACPECGAMMFASWPKGEMFPALVTPFYGATCGICGFRYAEHEGHIIPCPRCAATALEQQVVQAQAERDNVLRNYRHVQGERDVAESRLAHADAREAAMREVLVALTLAVGDESGCAKLTVSCTCGKAEKLVAAHQQAAYFVRDALDKRGEEG